MLKDEKQLLWKLSAGFLGAALPLVILGPGVMAASLVVGIFLGLLATKGNSLRSTVKYVLHSKVVYMVMALFTAFMLSSYFSIDKLHSMNKMGDLFGMGALALMLFIALREMPTKYTEIIHRSLAMSTVVVAAFCLIDAFVESARFSHALHGETWQNPDRLEKMSAVFAVVLPFVWAWLFRRYHDGDVFVKWLSVPVVSITLVAVFVCAGYVGWAALIVALAIFLYYSVRYHDLKLKFKPVLASVVLVIFALLCFGWAKGFNQPEDFATVLNAEEFTPRVDLWQVAGSHMFNNPFTGTGVNTFRFLTTETGTAVGVTHPHNFLLQLFLETGFLGGILAISLLVIMFRYFMKASKSNLYGVAGLASIVAFSVAALTHTSIFHPWWLTMLIFSGILSARVGWDMKK